MGYYDKLGAKKYEDIVMLFRVYKDNDISLEFFLSEMEKRTKDFGSY